MHLHGASENWSAIGSALPNGAGVEAVRSIVYFDARSAGGDLLVLAIYAVAGAAVALCGTAVSAHRAAARQLNEVAVA